MSSVTSHTVLANGVNLLNFDMKTLVLENGSAVTICEETPTITVTEATFISNNRPNYLKVNGSLVQWNEDLKPIAYTQAEAHIKVVYSITTTQDSVFLTFQDFAVLITPSLTCEISTFVSLSTQSSMVVESNGVNDFNFDTRNLVVVSSDLYSCSNETPTVSATISTLSNDKSLNL